MSEGKSYETVVRKIRRGTDYALIDALEGAKPDKIPGILVRICRTTIKHGQGRQEAHDAAEELFGWHLDAITDQEFEPFIPHHIHSPTFVLEGDPTRIEKARQTARRRRCRSAMEALSWFYTPLHKICLREICGWMRDTEDEAEVDQMWSFLLECYERHEDLIKNTMRDAMDEKFPLQRIQRLFLGLIPPTTPAGRRAVSLVKTLQMAYAKQTDSTKLAGWIMLTEGLSQQGLRLLYQHSLEIRRIETAAAELGDHVRYVLSQHQDSGDIHVTTGYNLSRNELTLYAETTRSVTAGYAMSLASSILSMCVQAVEPEVLVTWKVYVSSRVAHPKSEWTPVTKTRELP